MTLKPIFLLSLLFLSTTLFAQTNSADKKAMLCRTWHLYKYHDQNNKTYKVTPEMRAAYIKYNADGTFEDKEPTATYTGKWIFDTSKMIVTLIQTKSKDYPAQLELKILTLTNTEFDYESNDFSSAIMTIYMNSGK